MNWLKLQKNFWGILVAPISIELVLKNLIFARIFFMILSLHILLSNFLIKIFQEYQKDWNTKEKDSPLFYIFSFW